MSKSSDPYPSHEKIELLGEDGKLKSDGIIFADETTKTSKNPGGSIPEIDREQQDDQD
jgi:hypothetical protein